MKSLKFSNGVRCILKERSDLNSVTVSVWIKAGASYESDSNRGVAHFLEHVLFNESENLPPGRLDLEVELMGGEVNAATSYDYTYYYISAPKGNEERALELLAELVLKPLFTEKAVEKEKPIVLEEIARSKDNPQELFLESFMEKLYEKAPYRYPILGFKDSVASLTVEDLREFYENHYLPERLVVSVCGNFNSERLIEKSQELFGSFDRKGTPEKPESETAGNVSKEFELRHPLVAVPSVLVGWKLPPAGRHDLYYEILDSLLSSGRSAYLYQYLRERSVVYAAYSNYQSFLFGSNFFISAVTEKPDRAVEEVKRLLREKVLSISRKEFCFARDKLYKGELFARESGEVEADSMGYALAVMEDEGYFASYFSDLKEADYETFLRRVSFLQEEPVVGFLLPES